MCIVLLSLIGLVVFWVGQVVIGIARESLRKNSPPKVIVHPLLGRLEGSNGNWQGKFPKAGATVSLFVVGDSTAPDSRLLDKALEVVGKFGEIEALGIQFLREQEPSVARSKFVLYGLELLDPSDPTYFTLEFRAEPEDFVVWRVSFKNGVPFETNFDD